MGCSTVAVNCRSRPLRHARHKARDADRASGGLDGLLPVVSPVRKKTGSRRIYLVLPGPSPTTIVIASGRTPRRRGGTVTGLQNTGVRVAVLPDTRTPNTGDAADRVNRAGVKSYGMFLEFQAVSHPLGCPRPVVAPALAVAGSGQGIIGQAIRWDPWLGVRSALYCLQPGGHLP
jgi:hypothetical protein